MHCTTGRGGCSGRAGASRIRIADVAGSVTAQKDSNEIEIMIKAQRLSMIGDLNFHWPAP